MTLVVIEGLDGAGKRTLTGGLQRAFEAQGRSVTTLAFPRYGQSITADLASEALHGAHGDLASSVYAMAVLFALDRAGAKEHLAALGAEHDVVILDRYVASNAAYSAARLGQDADGEMVSGVGDLDDALQRRTGAVYAGLAAAGWCGAWTVVGPEVDPGGLAADLSA